MPSIQAKCKNKFCQQQNANQRPKDKPKFAEMFKTSASIDIRLCFHCQELFDFVEELTTREDLLKHCHNVFTNINTEISILNEIKNRV